MSIYRRSWIPPRSIQTTVFAWREYVHSPDAGRGIRPVRTDLRTLPFWIRSMPLVCFLSRIRERNTEGITTRRRDEALARDHPRATAFDWTENCPRAWH